MLSFGTGLTVCFLKSLILINRLFSYLKIFLIQTKRVSFALKNQLCFFQTKFKIINKVVRRACIKTIFWEISLFITF
jgi:hypothetical protein